MVSNKPRRRPELTAAEIPEGTRRHVANSLLAWIRSEETFSRVAQQTALETRDELRRMMDLPEIVGLRIANELFRWLSTSDQVRDLQWLPEGQALSMILRVFDRSADKVGAENDRDLTNDETAPTYTRIFDRIAMAAFAMRQYAKGQQRIGTRAGKAERILANRVLASAEEWVSEV